MTLTSRQDTEKYDSKQVSAGASGSIAYGSGGGASVNAAYSKAKVDYAQVREQTGIQVGEEGMNATIHNHTQLNGAIIESQAQANKNRFKTGSISHTDIENISEIKTESASVSAGSGGINPMQAISSALSLLGNRHESERSTTKSAISANIHIETKTPENLTALSRDTQNANEQVNKQDLKKVQERQEMAKVIGEISNNAIQIATYEEREKINKLSLEKFKAEEKYGKDSPQAQQLGKDINQIQENIDRTYGIGSEKGMAIRAVTAALQAAAQNDSNGAIVALASPYLNQKIHEMTDGDTTKDKATNLIAHALLSAVEFQVTGKDPLTGAIAGVTGEVTAEIIAQKLYEKSPKELTASEKENISTLSQLAGGLAGAFTAKANGTSEQQGGVFITATAGAETAKRAVENNTFWQSYTQWKKEEKLREEDPEAYQKLKEEQFEVFKDALGFAADFTPVLGDAKSFADAEDSVDYLLATVGIIPGADIVTKPLKEAKIAYQNARKAEKLGNTAAAKQHLDTANSLVEQSLKGIYDSKQVRASFEKQYGKGVVTSTTVPPSNAKNVKLAGQRHPKTGVPFDNKGFPIFDQFTAYDTRIDISRFKNASYTEQMKMATKDLADAIERGHVDKNQFTSSQLEAIYQGNSKIPGLTWHHHQDTGRMQLIDTDIHKGTGHIGGEGMKNGK
ncbi:hypothetical protein BKK54_11355 [Rodentibacter genomosp. 1]|uniref:VENN motif-containing domain-containing protein n=1 Tax=Rodentibacter genomosp. 1 TaxID=1908264 RepID=A0A1V3IZU8_9PAST|nr:HNH endonuclease [Rodentibacter genomosp. 1]OOF47808.1 hypothetical protein BKK54_11355 [Rodentibacter genomosp. 1]